MSISQAEVPESRLLTPEETALFAELTQAAKDIENQARGAFLCVLRQRGLTGNWQIKGDKLVKVTSNGVEQHQH